MKSNLSKLILSTAIAGVMTSTANAGSLKELNPYIGIDYQRTTLDYNSNYTKFGGGTSVDGNVILEDALNGFNVHAGIRPHKHVGFELGYFYNIEESKSIANGSTVGTGTVATANFTTDVTTQGLTFDALGYLPIDKQERFELIGTAGLSITNAEVTFNVPGVGAGSADETEVGFRAGLGGQINVNENLNFRAIGRYQTADFEDVADDSMVYTVGLNYKF